MVRAEFFRAGFSVAVVIVLQLFSTSGLEATVLRYLPLDRQCAEARIIAVARAEDQVSAWNPEKTRIYTETRFTLEEVLKGKVSRSLTVRQLGGRVGDIAQSVAGSPVFVKGRRYVLFLAPLADGKYRIVGFSHLAASGPPWAPMSFLAFPSDGPKRYLGGKQVSLYWGEGSPESMHGLKGLSVIIMESW